MNKKIIFALGLATIFLNSCNIDESLNDSVTTEYALNNQLQSASQTLDYIYTSLTEVPGNPWNQWALNEDSSDEEAKPTRGSDWYDGGKWQQLHLHTWGVDHPVVADAFNATNRGIAYSTQVLGLNPSASQRAEGTFMQVFYLWQMTDQFGQTILREPNEEESAPSILLSRSEAIDYEIAKLEAVMNDLPAFTQATAFRANKNAGYALLAKLYLNKAVYKATDADGKPQVVAPSAFASADMDKVIQYADLAMAGRSFTNIAGNTPGQNYFQNFAPNNGETSTEIIFTHQNTSTNSPNMYAFGNMTLHYNQNPSGWNGPSTTTNLYNLFTSTDPNDPRLSSSIPYLSTASGLKAGILSGQQYDQNGKAILTRQSTPLIFVSDFNLTSSTEAQGLRVIKYMPDYKQNSDGTYSSSGTSSNDFVFLSYSDCLLMKAEANARKGDLGNALTLVNTLRTARGATALSSITLNGILDERGRELYWQGHRRTDQIRFGMFLQPVQGRSTTSDRHVMIYPIPLEALNANPKMKQNPGY